MTIVLMKNPMSNSCYRAGLIAGAYNDSPSPIFCGDPAYSAGYSAGQRFLQLGSWVPAPTKLTADVRIAGRRATQRKRP